MGVAESPRITLKTAWGRTNSARLHPRLITADMFVHKPGMARSHNSLVMRVLSLAVSGGSFHNTFDRPGANLHRSARSPRYDSAIIAAHVCPWPLGASCDLDVLLVTRYCFLLASSASYAA